MQSELSEKMLLQLAELKRSSYTIPTMNIFNPPNELKPLNCNWFKGLTVSSAEFISQVFIFKVINTVEIRYYYKYIVLTKYFF